MQVEHLVDGERDDVFLEDELDQVGERLQAALASLRGSAQPVLNHREDPPLGIDRIGDSHHDADPEDGDLEQRPDDELKIDRIQYG
jgi:hypothetical protein